ncbi:MAG: AAA family ATPase [Bacteroides sp.]|nr:AAA family ATPase [Bacteroides sp.]
MQLIYCYIAHYKNIVGQEVNFSDTYRVRYDGGKLHISKKREDMNREYVYDSKFMRNLRVLVGKTGSGKTNFLQLVGMDEQERFLSTKKDAYLLLYKCKEDDRFMVETLNVSIEGIPIEKYFSGYRFDYDFEKCEIVNSHLLDKDEHTVIINVIDRSSFAYCPYEDVRVESFRCGHNTFFRKVTQLGNSSVSLECECIKDYISQFSTDSVKQDVALVIKRDNWRYKNGIELDENLLKKDYWTYYERANDKWLRKGMQGDLTYDKMSTPKSRFLHDLMTDFAIYLRKWAACIDPNFPEKYHKFTGMVYDLGIQTPKVLPDGKKISILKRINWLCQYIDYHTDESTANKGLLWQIGQDIIDLFRLLGKMDDKYFTDEEFRIPARDIDMAEKKTMWQVFERMEQYRPDDLGIFTKCLLPYHWSGISSGEYQYAKVWGVIEEYGVKVKLMKQGESFKEAISPNLILLLDEPESYMHPEMCRLFIKKLNEVLKKRMPEAELQVILSTHSPFMLSDVLSEQVIKMDYDEKGHCLISPYRKPCYAANIHTIMADGFFLNYTIGEQARIFLTEKFDLLKRMLDRKDSLSKAERLELEKMKALIPEIGDDIIRNSFETLIRMLYGEIRISGH